MTPTQARAAGYLPPDVTAQLDRSDLMGSPRVKWNAALRRGLVSQDDYDRARLSFSGDRWYRAGD